VCNCLKQYVKLLSLYIWHKYLKNTQKIQFSLFMSHRCSFIWEMEEFSFANLMCVIRFSQLIVWSILNLSLHLYNKRPLEEGGFDAKVVRFLKCRCSHICSQADMRIGIILTFKSSTAVFSDHIFRFLMPCTSLMAAVALFLCAACMWSLCFVPWWQDF
jgi:hypothetical protein